MSDLLEKKPDFDEAIKSEKWINVVFNKSGRSYFETRRVYPTEKEAREVADEWVSGVINKLPPQSVLVLPNGDFFCLVKDLSHTMQIPWK